MRLLWYLLLIILIISSVLLISPIVADESPEINSQTESTKSSDYGKITLNQGWNFISIPRRPASEYSKASLFENVETSGRNIWTYKDNKWQIISKEDTLQPLEGYFIYSVNPVEILIQFSTDPLQVPPTKELASGWNMIGLSGIYQVSPRDMLLSVRKSWNELIRWDAVSQHYMDPIINNQTSADTTSGKLEPYQGYWLSVNENVTLASIGV